VSEVFPSIPPSIILDDLRITNSVEMTIDNIVEGRLTVTPVSSHISTRVTLLRCNISTCNFNNFKINFLKLVITSGVANMNRLMQQYCHRAMCESCERLWRFILHLIRIVPGCRLIVVIVICVFSICINVFCMLYFVYDFIIK